MSREEPLSYKHSFTVKGCPRNLLTSFSPPLIARKYVPTKLHVVLNQLLLSCCNASDNPYRVNLSCWVEGCSFLNYGNNQPGMESTHLMLSSVSAHALHLRVSPALIISPTQLPNTEDPFYPPRQCPQPNPEITLRRAAHARVKTATSLHEMRRQFVPTPAMLRSVSGGMWNSPSN